MTTTYTREQLTARQMNRPKLETIAIDEFGINADVVRLAPNKPSLIDMILLAQIEDAVGTEDQAHPEDPDVVQVDKVEDEPAAPPIALTTDAPTAGEALDYEQRLIYYFHQCSPADDEAAYLLQNWEEFKRSLIPVAPAAPTRRPRSNTPRTAANPAEKLAQAQDCLNAIRQYGTPKAAAEALGKSPHYTKVLAKAAELHEQSAKIRVAYDSGELKWTGLYNLAFGCKKSDTIATIEARLTA